MLITIAQPAMTGLYCTPPIHRQLNLNSSTTHRYWILDRRAQTHFEIPMRSVLQYGMSLLTTCYASQRLAVDRSGLLNANTSIRQYYDDKNHTLAVLSTVYSWQSKIAYFMPNEAYQPKSSHFREDSMEKMLS